MQQAAANPAKAKEHMWPETYEGWAEWVDSVNAEMCLKNGWHQYIIGDLGGSAPVPLSWSRRQPQGSGGLAAGIKRLGVGISIGIDWLGDDLIPVPIETSERRAAICVPCPQNGDPNLFEKLTGLAAEEFKKLVSLRHEMDLKTSRDAQLQTCKACGCDLKSKVWVKLKHILKNTPKEDMERLDAGCWIRHEQL